MKRNTFFLSILFFSIFIFSCATASGSYVLTGKQKTETTSDKVQIYTELPPEYEIIGIVMYNMVIPIEAQNVSAKAIYVPE